MQPQTKDIEDMMMTTRNHEAHGDRAVVIIIVKTTIRLHMLANDGMRDRRHEIGRWAG